MIHNVFETKLDTSGGPSGSGSSLPVNEISTVAFKSSFSLKDFLKEKIASYVDTTKYTIEAYDEQLESYENSANNAIILIVKALSGYSTNDKISIPYQVLVYTPEIQNVEYEDPIKMVLDGLNQLSNAYNGKTLAFGFSYVTLNFLTPTMLTPLVSENILFRGCFYMPVHVNEAYDFGLVTKIEIDNQEIPYNSINLTDVAVDSTTTNSATNKQDCVSKNKTSQILIVLTCDVKLNSFFMKLRRIRNRAEDINSLFTIKIYWNDGIYEQFNIISSQATLFVDKLNNNANYLQVTMVGSE